MLRQKLLDTAKNYLREKDRSTNELKNKVQTKKDN